LFDYCFHSGEGYGYDEEGSSVRISVLKVITAVEVYV
jgi:hypothetical protein